MDFRLWIETEIGDPDQPANRKTENFCNVQVDMPDGRKYALNLWTFDFVPRARSSWPYDGSQPAESVDYLHPPDLLVTSLDRPLLERVFSQLIESGEMKDEWQVPEDREGACDGGES